MALGCYTGTRNMIAPVPVKQPWRIWVKVTDITKKHNKERTMCIFPEMYSVSHMAGHWPGCHGINIDKPSLLSCVNIYKIRTATAVVNVNSGLVLVYPKPLNENCILKYKHLRIALQAQSTSTMFLECWLCFLRGIVLINMDSSVQTWVTLSHDFH